MPSISNICKIQGGTTASKDYNAPTKNRAEQSPIEKQRTQQITNKKVENCYRKTIQNQLQRIENHLSSCVVWPRRKEKVLKNRKASTATCLFGCALHHNYVCNTLGVLNIFYCQSSLICYKPIRLVNMFVFWIVAKVRTRTLGEFQGSLCGMSYCQRFPSMSCGSTCTKGIHHLSQYSGKSFIPLSRFGTDTKSFQS